MHAMLTKIQRAATMSQPAHNHLIPPQHLLAIDTQILTLLVRAFGNHQPPGNQRRSIARPAVLYRQTRKINIIPFPYNLLT
jgi:hypothetical protein